MALPSITNLIGHWKMNDNDSNTVVVDSRSLHNGVWAHGNTSTASIAGKINNALDFVKTDGDYLSVPHHTDFNGSIFSISMWANHPVNNIFWDRFFTKKIGYSDSDGFEVTLPNFDGTQLLYVIGSNSTFSTINMGITWAGTGWHHMVMVFNGNTFTLYIDHIQKTPVSIASVTNNTNPLIFGANLSPGEIGITSWHGQMDDIRYYNIILTQDHVDSLWNSGNGTESESDFVGYPLPYTLR